MVSTYSLMMVQLLKVQELLDKTLRRPHFQIRHNKIVGNP